MTQQTHGAQAQEIQQHYDVSNEFYSHWLDAMAYSTGFWLNPNETLVGAQINKFEFHCQAINAKPQQQVLDIGCGWGSFMNHLNQHYQANVSGLTLSPAQINWIHSHYPHLTIYQEPWEFYSPKQPLDAIVSIEAFEHFARPSMSKTEKINAYEHFFKNCATWLTDKGLLSLQIISYGDEVDETRRQEYSDMSSQVFPGSELPFKSEIFDSSAKWFELLDTQNWTSHYVTTCNQWRKNLHACRDKIESSFGEKTYQHYQRYLRMCEFGFNLGNLELHTYLFHKK